MCGDGIIYMWNVKSVINNLKKDILIKSVVLLNVKGKQGQSLLGNTKIHQKAKSVLKDGIKAQQELKRRKDIGVNQNQNIFKLLGFLDISKDIQKLENNLIKNIHIVGVDISLDIVTGKQIRRAPV